MRALKLFLVFTTLLSVPGAFACSCMEWGSASELLKQSHAVFLGIPSTDSRRIRTQGEVNQKTTMSILRGFKNAAGKKLSLYTWKGDGANCGVNFKKDQGMYLILAYRDSAGRLVTDGCSLTSLSYEDSETTKLIRELNEL